MATLTNHCSGSSAQKPEQLQQLTIVCDERCAVVRRLGALLHLWDRQGIFTFVDRDSKQQDAKQLMQDLDASHWSLFLIDNHHKRWYGPEAIPMILQNLPFGKLAAVFYILPGTMWMTRNLYQLVSHSRQIFSHRAAI